jgi:hypothetical protein
MTRYWDDGYFWRQLVLFSEQNEAVILRHEMTATFEDCMFKYSEQNEAVP